MRVLVVNAGSSSLKLALLGPDDETLQARELAAPQGGIDRGALRRALSGGLGEADAVGHRIVHGGDRFKAAVLIDRSVRTSLQALTELAPLHQPKSIAALDAVGDALADLPAVACFDTSFHASLPPAARTYAIPAEWRDRWHARRYGFHGLSHAWVARRVTQLRGQQSSRIVSCHLGAGASLCAITEGRSIDTTMGFTPLEGLVMATRSGSLDPGLLLWLLQRSGLSAAELASVLEHKSGLLGLSGTGDMRQVLTRAAAGDARAGLARDVYVHRLRSAIGSMAAALGGLDVLVFTGGVGENSAEIRRRAAEGLGFLGVAIDPARNESAPDDSDLSAVGAHVATFVVRAREDREIARQVRAALSA